MEFSGLSYVKCDKSSSKPSKSFLFFFFLVLLPCFLWVFFFCYVGSRVLLKVIILCVAGVGWPVKLFG